MSYQSEHRSLVNRYFPLKALAACLLLGGVLVASPPAIAQSLSALQQQALEAVAQEDWAEAARLYQQAIETAPDRAGLYNNLGVALRQTGDTDGAIEAYRKAIELDQLFGEAYGNLAVLLLVEGQWEETIEITRQARVQGVSNPTLALYFGLASEQVGNWENAALAYDRYLRTDASAPNAYRSAIAFWQAGDGREAIRAFRRASSLDPAFGLYVSETGLALARLGATDNAIDILRELPVDWSQPRDFVVLARLAQQEDMLDLAEASILRAFQLSQQQGDAIPTSWVSDVGAIEASRGDYAAAESTLQDAIDGSAYSPDGEAVSAVDASGSPPAPLGDVPDLFDLIDRASSSEQEIAGVGTEPNELDVSQTDRDVAIASANLADTYLTQGKNGLALTASEAAIAADDSLPLAHNNRGAAQLALGELDAAGESFLTAIELQPDYWQAQRNLGIVYIQQGDREQAREYLAQAMDNAPTLDIVQQINREMVELERSTLPDEAD